MDKSKELETIIQTIIETEGLKDAVIEYEKPKDTGYICSVKIVNIKHSTSTLSLFLKHLPENVGESVERICENECNFYQHVLTALRAQNPAINDFVPKSYHQSKEVLILENLLASGLRVWKDLKTVLDEEHVLKVMETYGRFHAASAALKRRSPGLFEKVSAKIDCIKISMMRYDAFGLRKSVARKAASAFSEEEREHAAFLKFADDEMYGFLDGMFEDDELDVIIHGDCWPHNYVFGYEGSKVNKAYLIDFQVSFRASPIIDLSYFMCTSGCSKAHFDKMETYLKHYHNAFSTEMQTMGLGEKIPAFETLLEHWYKYGKYGLIWSMFVNKMMTADADEIVEHRHQEVLVGFDFVSRNERLYQEKMRDSIGYFYANKSLSSML